ncbi:MAG TPA: glycosyltransferase [Candidatus Didemnitutus sp.]|nr:glycosyltransferase [Candidatus Didemnitutus sp.]
MKRVLIVSPHFPPTNAPDMQRARQCLPHLTALGWQAEVLAVDPADATAPRDPLLLETLPAVPVHRVRALPRTLGRLLGLGSLGLRAHRALDREGDRLLREKRFDLVFFTTTQFVVMTLGARWQREHGVPYVVDWQDPWVTDYYDRPGAPPPPGGWKYRFAARQARKHEGPCLRDAAGLVSTSPEYVEQLKGRYAWFASKPAQVIPFGADPVDFAVARDARVPSAFERRDGTRHLVYVGAVGPIMRPALELLFAGLNEHLRSDPAARSQIRLHFVGTSYAPAGQATPSVLPLAESAGVADCVEEHTDRVGHFVALKTMLSADALLLLGSADRGYSPSKIATLALAGKPVLALIPGGGQLDQTLASLGFAQLARFSPAPETNAVRSFLASPGNVPAVNRELDRWKAMERTRELAEFFSRALDANASARRSSPAA